MAGYNAYNDLAQRIAGGLIVTDINEMVQFVADKSSLRMLQLMGGTIPSGVPGQGFKTRAPIIGKKAIKSYQYQWIKQAVAEQDLVLDAAKTTETTLVLTAATYSRAVVGGMYQVEHPTTGAFLELVYVVTLSGTPNIVVRRNIGSTSNAVLPDESILRRRGHNVADRSSQQGIQDIDPETDSNLTESLRVDWEITWKAAAMQEYGNLNDPAVIKRRKLYEYSKYKNWSMLYGKGGTSTDANGKRIQFMTGLVNKITSNIYGSSTVAGYSAGHGGEITLDKYRNIFLRRLTRFTPDDVNDIIVLHGDLLEKALDAWTEEKISNFKQTEPFLGWTMQTVVVNGKRFHHLFDAIVDEQDTGSAIAFPVGSVKYLYTSHNGINLDDKHYEIDFAKQGITSQGGFYYSDYSLEIGWEQGMGYMNGVTNYA